eukprot:scaffold26729_cov230-Skeletonema_menzelii.AAC.1
MLYMYVSYTYLVWLELLEDPRNRYVPYLYLPYHTSGTSLYGTVRRYLRKYSTYYRTLDTSSPLTSADVRGRQRTSVHQRTSADVRTSVR